MTGASAQNAPTAAAPLLVDRYAIYDAIASGGMATDHLGRLIGTAGFLRTVAIKRLHAQYAHDAEFTSMFLDEARLASRIQHPNVVSTLDVVMRENELLLVMEYIRGESLSRLVRRARDRGERLPPRWR
jgi:serine/threonine protein kinase